MRAYQNILAVLQEEQDAPRLMQKLARLTAEQKSDISLIRVVYEGIADLRSKKVDIDGSLKELVLAAAQTTLRDTIEASGVYIENLTSAAMWHRHPAEAIIDAAADTGAELIVKTPDHNPHSLNIRTPDDWHLLRNVQVPVLLTGRGVWAKRPTVAAAIDIYDPEHKDLNTRIVQAAAHLCEQLDAELHLACVFPTLSKWMDEVTTVVSYVQLREDIEQEIFEELGTFAKTQDITEGKCHAVEGEVVHAMHNLVGLIAADILVMGTKARAGLSGVMIGNTAEKLLHNLPCDILTVP